MKHIKIALVAASLFVSFMSINAYALGMKHKTCFLFGGFGSCNVVLGAKSGPGITNGQAKLANTSGAAQDKIGAVLTIFGFANAALPGATTTCTFTGPTSALVYMRNLYGTPQTNVLPVLSQPNAPLTGGNTLTIVGITGAAVPFVSASLATDWAGSGFTMTCTAPV